MTIGPGTKLGAYEVQDLLGEGAMGTVYRAYDAALARTAAIKVLQAIAADPESGARFRREAQTIARMRHPNVLNVYDFGDHEGTPYVVVEYVPGGSLHDRLKAGDRFDQAASIAILEGIAAALDHAHSKDIVHRDVKPANVLLDSAGDPILADFGLAKLLPQASLNTATGVTTGTPAYMSPEQVMGASVGPAADTYALATMAYELLAGAIPFAGDDVLELLYAHVHRVPPAASSQNPQLGPAVDAALARGLAKDPAARWDSGTALVVALRDALAAQSITAPPPTASGPAPALAGGATIRYLATPAQGGPEAHSGSVAPRAGDVPRFTTSPAGSRGPGRRRPLTVAAIIGVAVIAAAALVLALAARNHSGSPKVSISPSAVRHGASLRLSASGFAAGRVVVAIGSPGFRSGGTVLANSLDTGEGSLATTLRVPSGMTPGRYELRACNAPAPGTNCATTPITVTR